MKKFIINPYLGVTHNNTMTNEETLESFSNWMNNHMYGMPEYGYYAPSTKWSLTYEHGVYWFETNDKYLHRNMWQFRPYASCYNNYEKQILDNSEVA
jgi:hypothetical protein